MEYPFPAGHLCFLVGHVRDPEGRPVAGAQLTALPRNGGPPASTETRTGFDGWFSLGPLAREVDYLVCVAPIADAGWTRKIPVQAPPDASPADLEVVVEVGGTVLLRFTGIPVLAGPVKVRLLRGDGSVAAEASVLEGLPLENYDTEVFGDTCGCVEAFRSLPSGDYRVEAAQGGRPLPGTPVPIAVSATEPTMVRIGGSVPPPWRLPDP